MSNSWGRWGSDDETGALNLVTDEVTRRALNLVQSGQTLALAQPLGPSLPTPPHRNRPSRFMNRDAGDYALGARAPGGFKFAEDTVVFPTHSGTHVDALAHAWAGDALYNGHHESSTRTTRGAQRCGADKLLPALTRGVLIDAAAANGGPLPASTALERDDLRASILESGVTVEPGDAVLIRTGWSESRGEVDYFSNEPGITERAALWLAEQGAALVGADNYAVETQSTEPGFPAHLALLHRHGVPLIENLILAPLARALAERSRSTFLFVFAPILLVGSTGAPINPLAVL